MARNMVSETINSNYKKKSILIVKQEFEWLSPLIDFPEFI